MKDCQQSPTETVWEHCQKVSQTYFDLLQHPSKYSLPKIIQDYWQHLIQHQESPEIVRNYLEWHDCGKPFCQNIDEQGRAHFPNHAEVSQNLFLQAGGHPKAAEYIGLDMVFHLTKPAEISKLGLDVQTQATLILTAWAALYSNAEMFGGQDAENFKIKHSQMTARCKKSLKR